VGSAGRSSSGVVIAVCAVCGPAGVPAGAGQQHQVVPAIAAAADSGHDELPHVPEREFAVAREDLRPAAYPPAAAVAPFRPLRMARGRPPARMTGRSWGMYPVRDAAGNVIRLVRTG
jgi:hypothetical protein